MNGKKLTLLVILLLILDQALKIWVKTHMTLGEAIILIPDWFQLYFIENKGAAFGMHIATPGTMDWGKLLLGLFRIGMVVALIWLIRHFMRKKAPKGVLIGFGLILAGAIGNIIDSAFYGLIFSASTPDTVAHFGGHYAGFTFVQRCIEITEEFECPRTDGVCFVKRFRRNHYFPQVKKKIIRIRKNIKSGLRTSEMTNTLRISLTMKTGNFD